jgi:hypothetical protein
MVRIQLRLVHLSQRPSPRHRRRRPQSRLRRGPGWACAAAARQLAVVPTRRTSPTDVPAPPRATATGQATQRRHRIHERYYDPTSENCLMRRGRAGHGGPEPCQEPPERLGRFMDGLDHRLVSGALESTTYEDWVAAGKPCLRQNCGHRHGNHIPSEDMECNECDCLGFVGRSHPC